MSKLHLLGFAMALTILALANYPVTALAADKKSEQKVGCVGAQGAKYKDFNDCMSRRKNARYCSSICK